VRENESGDDVMCLDSAVERWLRLGKFNKRNLFINVGYLENFFPRLHST
jgi:hypothetical protein